ncbi:MAG: phosphoribosylformylglycinamidine synthase [Deltaproteobacteria bacterium]|nr:phosphoribosylformylglycinamidine synthase [Deltaproteobacteria bacterium]
MTIERHFVQIRLVPSSFDVRGARVAAAARARGLELGSAHVSRVYEIEGAASVAALLPAIRHRFSDPILEEVTIDEWSISGRSHALVGRLPGVTDDEGMIAAAELEDAGIRCEVASFRLYDFEREVPKELLERFVRDVLSNPVVDQSELGVGEPRLPSLPHAVERAFELRSVSLELSDSGLESLSKSRGLNLSIAELRAIRAHHVATTESRRARALPAEPTECELEVYAQTWSEHCKHKELNARISMSLNGDAYEIHSLFRTFIARGTEIIREKWRALGEDWMVTVFSDNAGVVRLDDDRLFVLKVETHNSPSALDPVGGAMTGVLGTNRDAFGTGKGGARLLFNTDVLCFGPLDFDHPLLPGQLHPARVAAGVVEGVEQAGNKCGVPTVNGAVLFDSRFSGKPLVYCGTGALLPARYPNGASFEKDLRPGDVIVMAGGRVGRDGIHGATFSSGALDSEAPRSVVQIGSPFTQKLLSDFLEAACAEGLISGCTDNGAGGLSSSVGELAPLTGGASVWLERVPLKYRGLEPWEILLSESQERMTLAVRPRDLERALALASSMLVEASVIGEFHDRGRFEIFCGPQVIASIDLGFLHDGVPKLELEAEWSTMECAPIACETGVREALLELLASPNIASREAIVRRFDHEVKGRSVIKPFMGENGRAPQDAAVLRVEVEGSMGLAVASGICPKFGDLDPYEMSAGAFDEAVRSLISVGARLPTPGERPAWSACDNFCVPNSVFDSATNPDGRQKLGKLVRMCEALFDSSTFFDIPMTSGKDSMKNDFVSGRTKISVPPTVLYTMVAKLDDVRRVVTSEWKRPGDRIYLLGATHDELGGSELFRLHGISGGLVPRVRRPEAERLYRAVMEANRLSLLASSHDLSDGGLGVAIAECCIGSGFGADIDTRHGEMSITSWLFSESHSRFLVSVKPEDSARFERIEGMTASLIGTVVLEPRLEIRAGEATLAEATLAELEGAWLSGAPLA